MARPRQFTLQSAGATLQDYSSDGRWNAIPAAILPGPAGGWYSQERLDLRGLLAGDETGIAVGNVILQEALPFNCPTAAPIAGIFVVDVLTTVLPTEASIAEWYQSESVGNLMPGFLNPGNAPDPTSSTQVFNPSQVVWGLWRQIAKDRNIEIGASNFGMRTISSGYFGEGETIVAPNLFWTRFVYSYDAEESPDGYPVLIPSANLVVVGMAVDLTVPEEITQMIRAGQR